MEITELPPTPLVLPRFVKRTLPICAPLPVD